MSETNEPEEELKSPLSKATANALAKQEKLLHAVNDALDAVFHMGCELGVQEERERIIKLLDEADSACSAWAIALIKEEKK